MTGQIETLWNTTKNNPEPIKLNPPEPNNPLTYEQWTQKAQKAKELWNHYLKEDKEEEYIKTVAQYLRKLFPSDIEYYIKHKKPLPIDY